MTDDPRTQYPRTDAALRRLERAVTRLEAAATRGAARVPVAELAAAKAQVQQLETVTHVVSDRLDAAIGRLRAVIEE